MPFDAVEQIVVGGPVLLEVKAQVKKRLSQQTALMEKHRDEQAPEAPIPVEEGMDRLELDMSQGRFEPHHPIDETRRQPDLSQISVWRKCPATEPSAHQPLSQALAVH